MWLFNAINKLSKFKNVPKVTNVKTVKNINYIDNIPKENLDTLKDSITTGENKRLFMNIVSPKVKKVIKKKWYDIKGHYITSGGIRHIFNRHGERAKLQKDEIPVTWNDIEKIPLIVNKPDVLRISKKLSDSWNQVLKYEKLIWNKYYYLEYLNNKNNFLETQTMYINKVKDKVKNIKIKK